MITDRKIINYIHNHKIINPQTVSIQILNVHFLNFDVT